MHYRYAAQLNSCLHAQRDAADAVHWEEALALCADGMCSNGKCNLIAPRETHTHKCNRISSAHACSAAATDRPLTSHTQACKTSAWPRNHLPCTWNWTAFLYQANWIEIASTQEAVKQISRKKLATRYEIVFMHQFKMKIFLACTRNLTAMTFEFYSGQLI